jgi:hypothetical protein
MAMIQTVCFFFLMFIPFRTPMFTKYHWIADAWSKYFSFVHLGTALCSFVVIPIIVIAYTYSNMAEIRESAFEGGLWIYCITSYIVALIWFPTQIF